ncbi:5-oxoprolinase subunit PxpB [Hydrogenophaga pseudoflava]|jgi:KipI family sensor histidine kinase inhibitor|uniref:5-oxoprolinase subunit PxpB n=1 Tax=Hydrogenophaga pseudoflava TaxID=47421 RepID=UPI00082491EF|nr:5-oxoprolinase subunit PxpB [Hydrogenophaga pseudoflava]
MTPRLLPLGDSAWTVEFGHAIDAATNARVMGLAGRVAAARQNDPLLAPVTDVVPTFRSLTVHFDPWAGDATALGRQLLSMAQEGQQTTVQGRQWQLPVCFDDDFAPDLPRVCELKQLSRSEVISQLLGAAFRVYMLGFQPGFPYMGGLPPTLVTPRLPSPRQKVPAKSVAIALDMCSVYPWESPGGWNLLGRTPVVLFDPAQTEQPAMLAAGDEVRWTAVDRDTHDRLAREIANGLPRETFLKESAT